VTVGEHLRCRLEFGRESRHVVNANQVHVIGQEAHVKRGNDRFVDWEAVALELELHRRLDLFLLQIFHVRHSEPAGFDLDLVRVQSTRGEARLGQLEELVLLSDKYQSPARDVALRFGQSQSLDAKGKEIRLAEDNRLTLLTKARVLAAGDPGVALKVICDQLLGIRFLLLAVELDDGEFGLGETGLRVRTHEAHREELLAEECAHLVLGRCTNVRLFELVNDASGDAIDQVDGQHALVCLVSRRDSEHGLIEELVEELAVLAEDRWQDVRALGSLRYARVLGLHVLDLLVGIEGDPPSVLRQHRRCVEAVAEDLALRFSHLGEVAGASRRRVKLNILPQVDNLAFALLGHGNERLALDAFIALEMTLRHDELCVVDALG